MHCYNHPEITARQLCGGCLKGLCPKCSIPVERRPEIVACSEKCQTNYDQQLQIQERVMMIYGIGDYTKKRPSLSPNVLAFIILGLFFIVTGSYSSYYYEHDFINFVQIIMGMLFVTLGIYIHFRQKKFGLRL